jgi:hypothetical protein
MSTLDTNAPETLPDVVFVSIVTPEGTAVTKVNAVPVTLYVVISW